MADSLSAAATRAQLAAIRSAIGCDPELEAELSLWIERLDQDRSLLFIAAFVDALPLSPTPAGAIGAALDAVVGHAERKGGRSRFRRG